MHIESIRERFIHPPIEYGPTPFWFLNDNLDEKKLVSTLEELKSKGIGGVIIHPRTGMEVEYLSDPFWERMISICETLKRLAMKGWLYDEYNWPSGPAGGKLLREHPEFKQVGLDYRIVPASRLEKNLQKLPGNVIAAYIIYQGQVLDVTDKFLQGQLSFSGEFLLFFTREASLTTFATCCAPWAKAETGYLDVLNPAAVDEFMAQTHLQYDRHIRRFYGYPIVGIFTDEPGNYSSLPYSHIVPREFENRYAENLRACLPSLADRSPAIPIEKFLLNRTRYFELVRDLYIEAYFKKMAAWASERNLVFTGHLNDDDNIQRLPSVSTSFFGPLAQMHMPGIDVLEDRHGFDREHPLLAHANFLPKAASSVAHHCGASRTLCEIWGGNGWGTRPERLKAVLNWVQACGVNFVNPHAVFMSLKGLRKRDFPASHFPPQPWWRFYRKFSDYMSRVSFLNSQGTHIADILFVFPLNSIWGEFNLKEKKNYLADSIEMASEMLLRNQLDFDFLFDEMLETRKLLIENGRINAGNEKYSLLLLPVNTVISSKLLEFVEAFAADGGKIIAFGYQVPAHDEYGGQVSNRVGALLGEKKPANVNYYKLGAEADSNFSWLSRKIKECLRQDLIIDGPLSRNFACLHRRIEGADSYFIANLSVEEGLADLGFRCSGRPQIWNPDDGSSKDVLAYKTDAAYTIISRHFHSNEAIFVVFTDEPPVEHVSSTNLTLTAVTSEYAEGYTSALGVRITRGTKRYTRSVEQAYQPLALPRRWKIDYPVRNIYLLDDWEIEVLSQTRKIKWSPQKDARLSTRTKFIAGMLRQMVSLKNILGITNKKITKQTTKYRRLSKSMALAEKWVKILDIELDNFDEGVRILSSLGEYIGMTDGRDFPPAGCSYAMTTTFSLEYVPDDLAIVYEEIDGGPASMQINGHKIERTPEQDFIWDSSNRIIPISTLVRKGRNRLRFEWRQPDFPSLFPSIHGIEPVCLVGRFWVKRGKIIEQQFGIPLIPWSNTGFPNYIGALTYRSSFNLPMKYMGQQLLLKFDQIRVAAEVKINDKYAGSLLWRPYVLDVTNLLKQGENTIEVTVANTAENLLGEPETAGLIGRPYIVPYWRHRVRFSQ